MLSLWPVIYWGNLPLFRWPHRGSPRWHTLVTVFLNQALDILIFPITPFLNLLHSVYLSSTAATIVAKPKKYTSHSHFGRFKPPVISDTFAPLKNFFSDISIPLFSFVFYLAISFGNHFLYYYINNHLSIYLPHTSLRRWTLVQNVSIFQYSTV